MVASIVLIAGVLLVMLIAAVVFMWMGSAQMLLWMVPWAPGLVVIGAFLLMLVEIPLLLSGRDDRRAALRDFGYLLPTFGVALGLWFVAQRFLW